MRLLIFLLFCPFFLSAQPAFLKDPDIVWAAEIEQDWVIDTPSLATEWAQGLTTLKIQRLPQDWRVGIPLLDYNWKTGGTNETSAIHHETGLTSPFLADLVYLAVLRGKLPVFKDPDCKIPLNITGAGFQDTVVTFDPLTLQEHVRAVYPAIDPVERITAWRLRQILAYHKKSARWTTTLEAIAPLVQVWDYSSNGLVIRPYFWFRPEDKAQKLSNDDIIWAKTTRNVQEKTRVYLSGDQVLKAAEGFKNPVIHLLQVLKNDPKTPFYDAWNEKPLSMAERTSLLERSDTVVAFDPETYEEKITIARRVLHPDSIEQLRLLQTWYWDEKKGRLFITLDGVGPLLDLAGEDRFFQEPRAWFYRRGKR